MNKIPEETWKVITARHKKGESAAVLAKEFGITDGAIYYHEHLSASARKRAKKTSSIRRPARKLVAQRRGGLHQRMDQLETELKELRQAHSDLLKQFERELGPMPAPK